MALVKMSSSSLVEFSSIHAKTKHPEQGNGHFTCVINNANRIDKAKSVVVHRVFMPNAFPNIKDDHWFVLVNSIGTDMGYQGIKMRIPKGWYTAASYIVAFNVAYELYAAQLREQGVDCPTGGLVLNGLSAGGQLLTGPLSSGGDAQYFTLQVNDDSFWEQGLLLRAERDTFDVLGFTTHTLPVGTTTRAVLLLYPGQAFNFMNPVLVTDPYNLSGEHYVYVAVKGMCEGNLVSSDGNQYNILAIVDLTETPYGTYRGFEATDLQVDDISFLDNINIHSADIMILDSKFRPLHVPLNHHVTIILKAFWGN